MFQMPYANRQTALSAVVRRPRPWPALVCALVWVVQPTAAGQDPALRVQSTDDAPATAAAATLVGADLPAAGDDRIGPQDVLSITVLQASDLNTSTRVSSHGEISLPLIGVIRAAGLTPEELERQIETRLADKYIRAPEVTVRLTELNSQPLSVVGAVRQSGTFQIRGTRTLLEALSLAGGLREDAGDVLTVLRSSPADAPDRPALLPPAAPDARQIGPNILEIKLKPLLETRDPRLNVLVRSGDVINVQSAAIVYIVGAIRKPGAFAMRGNDRLTVLRALALGEGALPTADGSEALVVRTTAGGERVEIAVNLDEILRGKSADVPLEAQDIFFIPTSGAKAAARATLDALTRVFSWRAPGFGR